MDHKQLGVLDTSITLVLQEIDRSLSEANQTLTERIIPAVVQYSQETRKLRENSVMLENLFTNARNLNVVRTLPKQQPEQTQVLCAGLATVFEEPSSEFDSSV